jgi:cell division protein FtsI (penicillin-binding protein 3)
VFLGTVQAGELSARAEDQRRVEREIPARRGSIISRDGRELAADRPAVMVTANPSQIEDPVAAARALAPLLDRPAEEIYAKLSRRSYYEVLARDLDPARAQRIADLSLDGIQMADVEQRFYPLRRVASQVVGLTGDGGKGISGLELTLDRSLTGIPGRRVELRDPFGRPLRVLVDQAPVRGHDVRLSLDAVIQERVEGILAETRKRYGAVSASAIVMRPSDGAIYAMASVPRFDPNDRRRIPEDAERARPVTDVLEPGSTFKVVTVAAALEEGLVTPSTTFALPTVLRRYDRRLRDAHERPPVRWSVSDILKYSSNIGTVLIAERVAAEDRLQHWIDRFGFGRPTGIDFPGEEDGIVLPPERWSGTSILNIPIGQGIGVTLMQMARAYAAVANGGRLVRPHLVTDVDGRRVVRRPGPRIMSRRTAHQLTSMLMGVVEPDGTGSAAGVQGYDVAGKTGTSNKIAADGTYDRSRYWASFIGYVPAERPQLVIAVVVDEPGGGAIYGGEVAAPAFEQIAEFSLGYLGIGP